MKCFVLIGLIVLIVLLTGCIDPHYNFLISFDTEYNYAISTLDENSCFKINDEINKANCFIYIAVEKANENICDLDPDNNSICYRLVAVEKSDYSLCDKPEFAEDRGICFADIGLKSNNLEICDSLNEELVRGWCYMQIAYKTENVKLCEKILKVEQKPSSTPYAGRNPRDTCYYYLDECKLVEDPDLKYFCDGGGEIPIFNT